jgi:ABC-2 type transport system permease protein
MVTIGAMVTSIQEGQQMASFISLFSAMPFMLNFVFLTNPNGLIAVGMSLFPLSAPLALMMRLPVAQIPAWQIVLSLSLLTCSAVLVVFGAARIFRAGMLQYSQAIKVRELPGILRESLKRKSNQARKPLS